MKSMKVIFSAIAIALSFAGTAQATSNEASVAASTNFEQNNQIIGDILKNAMNGRLPGQKSQQTEPENHLDSDSNASQNAKPHYQTQGIDKNGNIASIRFYRGNKIPPHIQQEIGKTFVPDFINYQPYTRTVKIGNGKNIRIPVRELPVYIVAKMANGETQTEILYPKPAKN